MNSKFEFLGRLPEEVGTLTASFLSKMDLTKLTILSKGYNSFFQPHLDIFKKLIPFLNLVVQGIYDEVKTTLGKDITLLSKRNRVIDKSGRDFELISGFEYALWALDKHMWTSMLDCIPQTEEGKKVLEELRIQYQQLKKFGVTYSLNGEKITEKHFDFQNTIINELEIQDNSKNSNNVSEDEINKQWIEGVGGAQLKLPVHVVYEYCSEQDFDGTQNFALQPKPSTSFLLNISDLPDDPRFIYEMAQGSFGADELPFEWFDSNSSIGIKFAICKFVKCAKGFTTSPDDVGEDLEAMKDLFKQRTQEFNELESQIDKLLNNLSRINSVSCV